MAELDPQRPWLGLDSFSEDTRGFFHGRDDEIAELGRRVRRKRLTVLFGQSGLGKTSILRAGVVPRLRDEGYCPVYIRIDYGPAAPLPVHQVRMAIAAVARLDGAPLPTSESLWALLHLRHAGFTDLQGRPVLPLLIFDQFEEMFTLGQDDRGTRARTAQFIEELACLVENRPPRELEARLETDDTLVERFDFSRDDVRVLITLREDYLAHLEQLKGGMPSVTQNRLRLAPMTGTQALAAVRIPGGALVSEEVAEAIVRFVSGGADLARAQVEPALLSLICRELNDMRIAGGRAGITLDLLAGSHASILADFYERAMAPHPPAARAIVEDVLLTESGYRENVALERIEQLFDEAGVGREALADLVDRRLLRIEERLNLRRVELTHDVLCSVVRASRNLRQEREARLANERKLREQRERELATRKNLLRTRQAAFGSAVLAFAAFAAFGFAWRARENAAHAVTQADTARRTAAIARTQAEHLINYLNFDFARQLEPIARLDLVERLHKRTVDYYDSLPSIEPGSDTEVNRAVAMVRYGVALRFASKFVDADKYLSRAVSELEARRARGDASETTAIALAEAYQGRRRLVFAQDQLARGLADSAAAVEVLRPWAQRPGASDGIRLHYAENLQSHAGIERFFDHEKAVRTFDEAIAVYRTAYRGEGKQARLTNALGLIAGESMFSRYLSGDSNVDAYADEHQKAIHAAIARNPADLALRMTSPFIFANHARIVLERQDVRAAVAYLEQSGEEFRDYLRLDPAHQHVRRNTLIFADEPLGWAHLRAGDTDAALRAWNAGLADAGEQGNVAALAGPKALLYASIAWLKIQTDSQAASASLEKGTSLLKAFDRVYPPRRGQLDRTRCTFQVRTSQIRMIQGDLAGAMQAVNAQTLRPAERATMDMYQRACEDQVGQQVAEIHLAAGRNDEGIASLSRFDAPLPKNYLHGEPDRRRQRLILLGLAHLRAGHRDAAAKLIAPMIDPQRRLVAIRKGDRMLEVQLAAMHIIHALAVPETPEAHLARARALLAALPPAMQSMYEVRRWRTLATELKQKAGKA